MEDMRRSAVLLSLLATLSLSAAAPKRTPAAPARKPPATVAPLALTHPIAQFLRSLSNDGRRPVTFKATAVGMRFFFEETTGVTVYRFEKGEYIKEEFLRGSTLAKAVKRYASKR
jgi:hypothetical protein